jgi:hypothetical protein
MKIDFEEGEAGYHEARALHILVSAALEAKLHPDAQPLLDFLRESATAHLSRPEYAALRETHGIGGAPWPTFSTLNHLWRRLVGPEQRESDLSQQRSEALTRAERAEKSAFEALAETARIGRERDQARSEVARLQQELATLTAGLGADKPAPER